MNLKVLLWTILQVFKHSKSNQQICNVSVKITSNRTHQNFSLQISTFKHIWMCHSGYSSSKHNHNAENIFYSFLLMFLSQKRSGKNFFTLRKNRKLLKGIKWNGKKGKHNQQKKTFIGKNIIRRKSTYFPISLSLSPFLKKKFFVPHKQIFHFQFFYRIKLYVSYSHRLPNIG